MSESLAHYKLGNFAQANEAFEVFIDHAKDSPYWPEVKSLMEENVRGE